ncbi:MAG: serine/threonine protein kinase [Candidatus Melainabacteria bacterium]|nr:serine/threonine protein kinase [Candidatus Melainabacteria bacterium]
MGTVYQATQEFIGRQVAVKILHGYLVLDDESLKRFHQQAKAASRLNHPHTITLYDYGVLSGGQPFIVMDLLKGQTLRQLLDATGNLSLAQALPIFKQTCEALADAHKHGVVHRDVKPDNIILEEHKSIQPWVKIVDFGIAQLTYGSQDTLVKITQTGTVCGSPTYMSPEQFQGTQIDHLSDIYSLAVVLFETLTGRLPFIAADLISLMTKHVSEQPPKLSSARPDLEFPDALEKMVARCLAKGKASRPQSMQDFSDELECSVNTSARSATAVTAQDTVEIPANSSTMVEPINTLVKPACTQSPASKSTPVIRVKPHIPMWIVVVAAGQRLAPYVLTLGLFMLLLAMISNNSQLASVMDEKFHWLSAQFNQYIRSQGVEDTVKIFKKRTTQINAHELQRSSKHTK